MLVSLDAKDILDATFLSLEDKSMLLDKRETALKDPLYDWTKSRVGREAMNRAREDYDIPDSMVAVILSEAKGKRTPKENEYIEFRRKMFDQIQDLKYEDQVTGSMKIYNKLRKEFDHKNITVKDEKLEKLQARRYEDYKQKAIEASEGMFSGEHTVEDILNEELKAGKITEGWKRRMMNRVKAETEAKKNKPAQQPTTKMIKYNKPTVQAVTKASFKKGASYGVTPRITGKNVVMSNLNPVMTKAAYPIMNKYGLTIKDAFRHTPGAGVSNSRHLSGNALDVTWIGKSIKDKQAIIREFRTAGFNGFGVGNTTLHIDMRGTKASWSYIGGTPHGGGKMPAWAAQAIRS